MVLVHLQDFPLMPLGSLNTMNFLRGTFPWYGSTAFSEAVSHWHSLHFYTFTVLHMVLHLALFISFTLSYSHEHLCFPNMVLQSFQDSTHSKHTNHAGLNKIKSHYYHMYELFTILMKTHNFLFTVPINLKFKPHAVFGFKIIPSIFQIFLSYIGFTENQTPN